MISIATTRDPRAVITPIFRIALPRDRLAALSAEERALLFLLGYAANQISMLSKLIIFSTNKTPDDPVEEKISAAQSHMLARFAIGILAESWETIRTRFLAQTVGKEYTALLDKAGSEALDVLKSHFGKSALLVTLRNSVAFHHPSTSEVEAAYAAATADHSMDEEWNVYMAQSTLNVFYFASDVVILHALLKATGEADLISAQHRIMNEVRLVSDAMLEFIYALFAALWKKNFGEEMPAEICADVSQAPKFDEYWLPFFVRVDPSTMNNIERAGS